MSTTIVRAAVGLLCLTLVAASDRPAAQTPSRGTSLPPEELAKLDGRLGIVTRRDRATGRFDGWLEGTIYNGTDRAIGKVVVLVRVTKGRRSRGMSREYVLYVKGLSPSIQPKTSEAVFAQARFTPDSDQTFTWSIVSAR